jgi:hypothetical protein
VGGIWHFLLGGKVNVRVHLYSQSQPVEIIDVENTYVKSGLFCVLHHTKKIVWKFPLRHIFRITEVEV